MVTNTLNEGLATFDTGTFSPVASQTAEGSPSAASGLGDTADLRPRQGGPGSQCDWSPFVSLLDLLKGVGFDRQMKSNMEYPFEPPYRTYLTEVIMGLRHGPSDTALRVGVPAEKSERDERRKSLGISDATEMLGQLHSSLKEKTVARVDTLIACLRTEAAVQIGRPLFWIVIEDVYEPVPYIDIEGARNRCALAWHALHLFIQRNFPDPDTKDWLFMSLPIVYSQLNYRILFDAFAQDRKYVSSFQIADQIIEKMMLVTHFEVAGFQVQADTIRKARRRLFLDHVLQNPSQNCLEYLNRMNHQEMLESAMSSMGPRLVFGAMDAEPLDEVIMRDVLDERAEQKRLMARTRSLFGDRGGDRGHAVLPSTPPTMGSSGDLLDTQAMLIAEMVAQYDLPRAPPLRAPKSLTVDKYLDLMPVGSVVFDRQLREMAAVADASYSGQVRGKCFITSPSTPGSPLSPKAPHRENRLGSASTVESDDMATSPLRQRQLHDVASTLGNDSSPKGMESTQKDKEKEAKLRRMKQELLHKMAATSPISPHLTLKELMTTWVSPMTKRLKPGAKDRNDVLMKTRSEGLYISMGSKNMRWTVPHSAGQLQPLSLSSSAPALNRESPSGAFVGTLQCVPPVSAGQHSVSLEPPKSLSGKVILKRLDEQATSFRNGSFKQYLKEYDVLTGEKRVRFDAPRLHREEAMHLRNMSALIGDRPKKMLRTLDARTLEIRMAREEAKMAAALKGHVPQVHP